jgi:tetratricopeptide (TPR) repeat protein
MDKFIEQISTEMQKLVDNGRISEAVYAMEEISSNLLSHLGLIWSRKELGDLEKAIRLLNFAIKIKPGQWMLHSNLAHLYNLNNQLEMARDHAIQSVVFSDGKIYATLYNLGVILANLGDHEGAISAYEGAMKVSDDPCNMALYNVSSSYLILKKWKLGWEHYNNRFLAFENLAKIKNRFKKIYTAGDDVAGKKLYVFSEQGIGDLIQFARYLPKLKELTNAEIIVESQRSVSDLIKNNFAFEVVPRDDGIWPEVPDDIESALSICNLPGMFNAGIDPIPNEVYIKNFSNKEPLQSDKFKIGLCWAGNSSHINDYRRSCYLREFLPLTLIDGVQFYSLQKDINAERVWNGKRVNLLDGVASTDILDLSTEMKTFSDTAFYISQMDLIITVDTSVAHLAGAMGKKTWLLVDKINDWRWGTSSDTNEWYPSIKTFRQKTLGDWSGVIQEISSMLNSVTGSKSI